MVAASARAAPKAPARAFGSSLADVSKPVLRRGEVTALRQQEVVVKGHQKTNVGALADLAFKQDREFLAELQRSRGALASDPVVTEEVIETADEVVLVSKTSLTLVDAGKLSPGAVELGGLRARTVSKRLQPATLDADQRRELTSLKAKLAGKPAGHPLKQAAASGDQALLDAVAAGLGDTTVTTTMVVKKGEPRQLHAAMATPAAPENVGSSPASQRVPGVQQAGEAKTLSKFVNGATQSDDFTVEKRWDFAVGFFKVELYLSYALGMRIPIQLTGTLNPTTISVQGAKDLTVPATARFSAAVLDADEAFYRDAGVPATQVLEGHEFVEEGRASVDVELKVLGKKMLDTGFGDTYSDSQDWRPPLGDGGGLVDLWIPAKMTSTAVSLGALGGKVEFGFGLTGTGEVRATYQSLVNGQVVPSGGRAGRGAAPRTSWTLTFPSAAMTRPVTTELEPLPSPGQRTFGYRLSSLEYSLKPMLIPKVRGTLWVDVPGYSHEWSLGLTLWFSAFHPDEPLNFTPYPSTKTTQDVLPGKKAFSR
jgi:hypothetical protein